MYYVSLFDICTNKSVFTKISPNIIILTNYKYLLFQILYKNKQSAKCIGREIPIFNVYVRRNIYTFTDSDSLNLGSIWIKITWTCNKLRDPDWTNN